MSPRRNPRDPIQQYGDIRGAAEDLARKLGASSSSRRDFGSLSGDEGLLRVWRPATGEERAFEAWMHHQARLWACDAAIALTGCQITRERPCPDPAHHGEGGHADLARHLLYELGLRDDPLDGKRFKGPLGIRDMARVRAGRQAPDGVM